MREEIVWQKDEKKKGNSMTKGWEKALRNHERKDYINRKMELEVEVEESQIRIVRIKNKLNIKH